MGAALELFWEKGFGETTLAEVIARAKVHPGSLYHYFKTKEELLIGALERLSEMLYPALLAPAWEKIEDPIERIFALLGRYRQAILATNFAYGCPVGRLAVEISPGMVDAHGKIAANFEGWSRAVRECLVAAGDRLPSGTDLTALSRFVLTVMEGGVMQARSYRSIEPFDQSVAQLREYIDRLMKEAVAEGGNYWKSGLKK
ncbi:MAG TPA: TetR/AcrR family transcriptional regulator [Candidatus Acidoferrales bacterium]|nr:TetR/AcrR family transcriptional regulator [Candidatus Acidoferrales bacterium]